MKQRQKASRKLPIRYPGKTQSTVWIFLYRNDELIRGITTKEVELKDQEKR